MSATDDPTRGSDDAGEDPMGSGAAPQEHEDPTEAGEFGEDPMAPGAEHQEHEDPTEGGEFGEDPTAS